jgi:tetratricopeptide (TPR) repeat protein
MKALELVQGLVEFHKNERHRARFHLDMAMEYELSGEADKAGKSLREYKAVHGLLPPMDQFQLPGEMLNWNAKIGSLDLFIEKFSGQIDFFRDSVFLQAEVIVLLTARNFDAVLKIVELMPEVHAKGTLYTNIANGFLSIGDIKMADDMLGRAENIFLNTMNDDVSRAMEYARMAAIYYRAAQQDKARKCIDISNKALLGIEDASSRALAISELAIAYLELDGMDKAGRTLGYIEDSFIRAETQAKMVGRLAAQGNLKEALDLSTQIEDSQSLDNSYQSAAEALAKLGKYDEAREFVLKIEDNYAKEYALEMTSRIAAIKGDFKEAADIAGLNEPGEHADRSNLHIASGYMQAGELDLAYELTTGLSQTPEREATLAAIAALRAVQGDTRRACGMLNEIGDTCERVRALIKIAGEYDRAGRDIDQVFTLAFNEVKEALALQREEPLLMSMGFMGIDEWSPDARSYLENALEASDSLSFSIFLARSFADDGDKFFKLINMAMALNEDGRRAESIELIKEVMPNMHMFPFFPFQTFNVLREGGEEDVLELVDIILARSTSERIYSHAAFMLAKLGHFERARALARSFTDNFTMADTFVGIANEALGLDDLEVAAQCLEDAEAAADIEKIVEQKVDLYLIISLTYEDMGQDDRYIELVRKARQAADDPNLEGSREGACTTIVGNLCDSKRFTEALSYARGIGPVLIRDLCLNRVGSAFALDGQVDRALEIAASIGSASGRAMVLKDIAYELIKAKDYDGALAIIEDEKDIHLRASVKVDAAMGILEDGNKDDALELVESVDIIDEKLRFFEDAANYFIERKSFYDALEMADCIKETGEQARSTDIRAKVNAIKGDVEGLMESLQNLPEYFRKHNLLAMVENLLSAGELSAAMSFLGSITDPLNKVSAMYSIASSGDESWHSIKNDLKEELREVIDGLQHQGR